MNILLLCKKFPYPVKDGESLAITHLSQAMHVLGCKMSLLAMNTTKHHFKAQEFPSTLKHFSSIELVDIDTDIKIKDALLNLLSKDSYHISRFVNDKFEQKLQKILQRETFDIIQLETLYLAPYIPIIRKYSQAKVVMRSHNVEHEIWERITSNTHFFLKKWYLAHLTQKLKTFEIQQCNQYDVLAAITQRDLEKYKKLGFHKRGIAIPIGIEKIKYQAEYAAYEKPLSIAFIGSLDWMPNIEGLTWFLEHIWESIIAEFPKMTLHIAGRNTPQWLKDKKQNNVIIHGEVEDAVTFINEHPLMVVPLKSGSGMRVKILEAMALGRTTITTSVGVEGIHATHQKNILIANTQKEFLEAIRYAVQHQNQLYKIGEAAEQFIEKEFDNISIAQKLLQEFYLITGKMPRTAV